MDDIQQFSQQVKDKLGLEEFDAFIDNHDNIELSSIRVPRDARKAGAGAAAMKALTDYADRTGRLIWLAVADRDSRTGTTSRSRLIKFYRQFGFVPNKGRNKRFELSMYAHMYRDPKGLQEEINDIRNRAGLPIMEEQQYSPTLGLDELNEEINIIRRRAGLPMIKEGVERAKLEQGKPIDLIVNPNKNDLDLLMQMVVKKLAGRKPPDGSHIKGFYNPTMKTVWIWDGTAATHAEVGSYLLNNHGHPEVEDWTAATGDSEDQLELEEEGGWVPMIIDKSRSGNRTDDYEWWVPNENVYNEPAIKALEPVPYQSR